MSVSVALAAMVQAIVIPLQKPPPQIERPRAPIATSGPRFAAECKDWDDYDMPAPPVRVHANTYLVGSCGITAILITGEAGHVLIDAGTPDHGADLIVANIRRLGFRPQDIGILLHSHEHFDHVGGMARLQQLTGAQLYASPAAAKVFASGAAGDGDPQAGMHKPFPAARVDHVLRDGEQVRIGDIMLTAIATPGHTPGALTWQWASCDGGICRRIVYADSMSAISRDDYKFSDHPAYLAAFRAAIDRVSRLECDILLTPHPSASDMIKRMAKGTLESDGACRAYATDIGAKLDERLAKEQRK